MNTTPSNRILIVEDEQDVVDMLTLNLRKADGFAIPTAADGVAGLKSKAERLLSDSDSDRLQRKI